MINKARLYLVIALVSPVSFGIGFITAYLLHI